jgi:hypothetical protein
VALVAVSSATPDDFGPAVTNSSSGSSNVTESQVNVTESQVNVTESQVEVEVVVPWCPRAKTVLSLVRTLAGKIQEEKHFENVGYAAYGGSGPSEGHPMQMYEGCSMEKWTNGSFVRPYKFAEGHVPVPKNTKDRAAVLVWKKTVGAGNSGCPRVQVALMASQQGYAGLLETTTDSSFIEVVGTSVKSEEKVNVTVKYSVLDYYESRTVLTALGANSSRGTYTVDYKCKPGWNSPDMPVCTQADLDASVAKMTAECKQTTNNATATFIKDPFASRLAACGCIKEADKAGTVLPRDCIIGSDGDSQRIMPRNTLVGWRDFCVSKYDECPNDDTDAAIQLSKQAGFKTNNCYEVRGDCNHPVFGATIRSVCPCACEKYCDNRALDHNAADYFGVGPNDTRSCDAIAAKSPELCDGNPLASGDENYFSLYCACTCKKLAADKPCKDNDKTLAKTAASIGQATVKSCAIAAQFGFCQHPDYGPSVTDLCCKTCPTPCKDDDKNLAATAASIGQVAVKSCAIAAQFGFCKHPVYGPTVTDMCQCACAPATTTEAPTTEAPTTEAQFGGVQNSTVPNVAAKKTHTATVTFTIPGNLTLMNNTERMEAIDTIADKFVKPGISLADITVTLSTATGEVIVTIKTTSGGFSNEDLKDSRENGIEFTYKVGGVEKSKTVKDFTANVVSDENDENETPSASATQLSSLTAVLFFAASALQFC